jgi:GAF domain-containing protein
LFFQNRQEFNSRIEYQKGQYQEINQTDTEAIELIAFLGFNRTPLHKQRQNHIKRLKEVFDNGNYSETQRLEHFRKHRQDLNFITAIENELELDLSEFYN